MFVTNMFFQGSYKEPFCQDIQTVTVCKQNSQFPMTTHTMQSFFYNSNKGRQKHQHTL